MEFTASVMAIIRLTRTISEMCGKYITGVKNENQDIVRLQQQTQSLQEVLQSLRGLLEDPSCSEYLVNIRNRAKDLAQCLSTLSELEEKIDPDKNRERKREKLKSGLKIN